MFVSTFDQWAWQSSSTVSSDPGWQLLGQCRTGSEGPPGTEAGHHHQDLGESAEHGNSTAIHSSHDMTSLTI